MKIIKVFSCQLKKNYKFAKEKQIIMSSEKIRIRVSGILDSAKSIGALVNLTINSNDEVSAANTLVWFPKLISTLEEIPPKKGQFFPHYYITCQKWFLEQKGLIYKI